MPVSPALLRAYRRTSYTVGGASVRVGRRSARMDALLGAMAAQVGGFITAWNPLSRRMPGGWNRRMQRALIAHTRRLPSFAGRGIGHGWSEEHVFIAADPRRLVVLARRFRQLGIVVVGRGKSARLVLLSWPASDAAANPRHRLQRRRDHAAEMARVDFGRAFPAEHRRSALQDDASDAGFGSGLGHAALSNAAGRSSVVVRRSSRRSDRS